MRQLGQQHGGLQGVEPPVHAQQRMVVPLETAMRTDRAHLLGERIVGSEQRAAVSKASQRLGREETRAADQRDPAALASSLGSPETLGAVLDHGKPVLLGNGVDAVVVGHLSEQADRENRFCAR